MAPPKNGVTIREVYDLIERLREEAKEQYRAAVDEVNKQNKETWEHINELQKAAGEKHLSYEAAIAKLTVEVYGEKDVKGLRGKVQDLERNTTIAHVIQVIFTAIGTAWAGLIAPRS